MSRSYGQSGGRSERVTEAVAAAEEVTAAATAAEKLEAVRVEV